MSPRKQLLAAAVSALLVPGCAHVDAAPPATVAAAPAEPPPTTAPGGDPLPPPHVPLPVTDPTRVASLSLEMEGLLRDQDELLWKYWTEGRPVEMARTYDGHAALFRPESIDFLRGQWRSAPEGPARRALAHLQAHAVGEYLAAELSGDTDELANLQAAVKFSFEGKDLHLHDLERALAREPSAEKRRALFSASVPAAKRLSAAIRHKNDRARALLQAQGYPAPVHYAAELRQSSAAALGALAARVLDSTDRPWSTVLDRLARSQLQCEGAQATQADLPRLFPQGALEAQLPRGQWLQRAEQTFAPLGMAPSRVKGLALDVGERKGKNPRPLALSAVVPTDVRLSVVPGNGASAWGRALHELGHALHAVHVRGQPFELAKLGPGVTGEASALLLEMLLEDPAWLENIAGVPALKAAEHAELAASRRLLELRRAAGKVLLGLRCGADPAEEPAAAWGATVGRALGVKPTPEDLARAELDLEDFLESADALRAAVLAAQLQSQLKARHGAEWWTQPGAGDLLRQTWAHGNALHAGALVQSWGEPRLDPAALVTTLGARLQVPVEVVADALPEDAHPPAWAAETATRAP
ncbi:MAG: hypothetical protein RL653_1795 [Pseudomonadota bacterium]|jgi:hypothetical protein